MWTRRSLMCLVKRKTNPVAHLARPSNRCAKEFSIPHSTLHDFHVCVCGIWLDNKMCGWLNLIWLRTLHSDRMGSAIHLDGSLHVYSIWENGNAYKVYWPSASNGQTHFQSSHRRERPSHAKYTPTYISFIHDVAVEPSKIFPESYKRTYYIHRKPFS